MHSGRVKIGNRQPAVWFRAEDSFVPSKGHDAPKIRTPDGREIPVADVFEKECEF